MARVGINCAKVVIFPVNINGRYAKEEERNGSLLSADDDSKEKKNIWPWMTGFKDIHIS